MALSLNAKEQQLLAVFISQLPPELPKVDWDVIAPLVGHKYARNARAAFTKVWEKLKAGDNGENHEGSDNIKAKTPSKPTPKRAVGPRKTPVKAGDTPSKKPRASTAQHGAAQVEKKNSEDVEIKGEGAFHEFHDAMGYQQQGSLENTDKGNFESENLCAYEKSYFDQAMNEDEA